MDEGHRADANSSDYPERARRILVANRHLRAALGGGHVGSGMFDLLLFLAAQGPAASVTTSSCCAAVDVPRTTALRWIVSLVDAGLVAQQPDAADGRVTLLRLTQQALQGIQDWMDAI